MELAVVVGIGAVAVEGMVRMNSGRGGRKQLVGVAVRAVADTTTTTADITSATVAVSELVAAIAADIASAVAMASEILEVKAVKVVSARLASSDNPIFEPIAFQNRCFQSTTELAANSPLSAA